MVDKNMKSGDEVQLEDMGVILRIPKEAVRLEMTVLILDEDGNLQKVCAEFSASDIREARQAFLDNVEMGDDYDAVWGLTEKGRRELDEMIADGGGQAFSPD